MEVDFNEQEKVSFRLFLIFSLFLLIVLNTGFSLNSAYFRVSKVEIIGNVDLFDESDLIKLSLGKSIWFINNDSFSDEMLKIPTIESIKITKEYPDKIKIGLTEYEKLLSITDLRGSVPKKSILYKNMVEIESEKIVNVSSLTITNGPLDTGFKGEMVSLIMTLQSYDIDVNDFNFIFDGDSFIGEYRDITINFGKPLDLGSKSSALGSLLENSECKGEIRFISKEELVTDCV
mgnify:CR=1 FL=1|tara:strand:+ start:1377 stop:2075 length:699 start_codon:yes stop_codon:yes gene_type:complete